MEADKVSSSYDYLPHNSGGFGKEPFWVQNLGYIVCKPLFFPRESFGKKNCMENKGWQAMG